ncbi:MAG: 4-(cytidine 5'-diphospho)-2-C-methyl-D-erythritol kinase [Putridiphycobacter sp.]
MVVYPNAKINIGLRVVEKRPDGFHNLESVFYPIPWYDIIEIVPADDFKFKSSGLPINGDTENNLVVKAFRLLQNEHHISNCHIHLHKQIPMGAGLGGGSADASFTLVALNEIFKLNLAPQTLIRYADQLGSDCPFFIENKPKYVTGKGEQMTSIDFNLSGYYIKLVNPGIHVSTKMAFEGLKLNSNAVSNLQNLTLSDLSAQTSDVKNDFEQTIFKLHPEIEKIKQKMLKEGALYAAMTGTGSTVYGIYTAQPKPSFSNYNEKILTL